MSKTDKPTPTKAALITRIANLDKERAALVARLEGKPEPEQLPEEYTDGQKLLYFAEDSVPQGTPQERLTWLAHYAAHFMGRFAQLSKEHAQIMEALLKTHIMNQGAKAAIDVSAKAIGGLYAALKASHHKHANEVMIVGRRFQELANASFAQLPGALLIAQERHEHLIREGFTHENDDKYKCAELIEAAMSYLYAAIVLTSGEPEALNLVKSNPPDGYPWPSEFWRPKDTAQGNLIIAGSLIAAELDRIIRASVPVLEEVRVSTAKPPEPSPDNIVVYGGETGGGKTPEDVQPEQ